MFVVNANPSKLLEYILLSKLKFGDIYAQPEGCFYFISFVGLFSVFPGHIFPKYQGPYILG